MMDTMSNKIVEYRIEKFATALRIRRDRLASASPPVLRDNDRVVRTLSRWVQRWRERCYADAVMGHAHVVFDEKALSEQRPVLIAWARACRYVPDEDRAAVESWINNPQAGAVIRVPRLTSA